MDTDHLIWEEKKILDDLRDLRPGEIKLWTLINKASADLPNLGQTARENRQVVTSLVSRLMREKKIKRNRKTNMVRISEVFA